jgi:hypothetical protein
MRTGRGVFTIVLGLVGCSGDEASSDGLALETRAEALSAGSGVLRNQRTPVLWSGSVGPEDAPVGGEPPECASVPCDHFRLRVNLPQGTFSDPNRPGGVQVALRWFGNPGPHELPPGVPGCCGEFDTLHLWVYKDGELRAASPGIIAVSQSAFLPAPENGVYDVWVAYDPSYNVAPFVEYEGLAEVEFAARIEPVKRLLPDLSFRGTERITFDTPSFPIFEPDPPAGSSCFLSEMDEDGAKNCLRFDQIIANDGRGPLDLEFAVPSGAVPEDYAEFPVSQRVFETNGGAQLRPAGEVEFHGVHEHYHYQSFATTELWRSDRKGRKLGAAPVTAGQKVSFCIVDIRIDKWAQKGDGPRTYMAPDCLFPASSDGITDVFKQGLTPGWADVYDWYIPDQYLEVTGVQNGFYRLEFCADPENAIEEEREDNNCLVNHLKLTGMGTPSQHAEVLGVIDDCD